MNKESRPGGARGYLEALLQSSPYAVIAIDSTGKITFVNKATSELMECEMRDLIGKNITMVYETEDKAKETNRRLYECGGVVHDQETAIKSKKGKIVPVRLSAAHIRDHAGNYAGGVGFFEAYRPWPAAEAQLKKHSEMLEADIEKWSAVCAPVFELLTGLSMVVIEGPLDITRLERVKKSILEYIKPRNTRAILIDLSTTSLIDGEVASHLVRTLRVIHLTGTRCMLIGLDTTSAHALEPLIADVGIFSTFSSVQAALESSLPLLGFELVKEV